MKSRTPQPGDLIQLKKEYMGRTATEQLKMLKSESVGICLQWSPHTDGTKLYGGVLRMLSENEKVTIRVRDGEMPEVVIVARIEESLG